MPPRKKKFIDKKNAVSFHLVHRSQRDPLQADSDAPQHVLLPVDAADGEDPASHKDEQREYGVYYDDDYDYMQHLKSRDELNEVQPTEVIRIVGTEKGKGIELPSEVFASASETDVGLLNKAAPHSGPRLDWDPDIVAGLDEDFDFEDPDNQLEDDFIVQANEGQLGPLDEEPDFVPGEDKVDPNTQPYYRPQIEVLEGGSDEEDYASDEADLSGDEEDVSDIGSLENRSFSELETKTRFTSYSMSSSVIKRNEGLALLDDRFEKLYEQYDDTEIGALDHEDIVGCVQPDSQVLDNVLQEFEQQQKKITLADVIQKAEDVEVGSDGESSDDELVGLQVEAPVQEKWDCESILSTYSTLYNHPKTIDEPKKVRPIRVNGRTDLPTEGLPERGLTLAEVEQLSRPSNDKACAYRPKEESTDEKKSRKQAVKAERKARREEKKANTMAFNEEKRRQAKEVLNVQRNLQGIKID